MATFEVKEGILHVIDDGAYEYRFRVDLIYAVHGSLHISEKQGIIVNNHIVVFNDEKQRVEFRNLVLRLQREAARPVAAPVVEVKPEPWVPNAGEIVLINGKPHLTTRRYDGINTVVVWSNKNSEDGVGVKVVSLSELSKFDDSKREKFADEIALLEAIKKVKGL